MTIVFIIHGAYGNPEENWIPWLKSGLEKLGHTVFAPKFPTPKNQSLENWNKVFKEYEGHIDENTILIGHSLAPVFLLGVIERHKVKAAFFISGFLRLLGNNTFDSINKTFVDRIFDWDKINTNCKHFCVYHSDNDPYVPIDCAHELVQKLNTSPIIISNAGHFNKKAGYDTFERLLADIKNII